MYLTLLELNALLRKPYFTEFSHKSSSQYALYRGHFNATVLTLRYSVLSPAYDFENMLTHTIRETIKFFSPHHKSVRGLIEYDLILKANEEESYYFWRANSNRAPAVPNSEATLAMTHNDIFLFIRHVNRLNPDDLNIFYTNSNVVVDRVVSVIFTFIGF